MQKVHGDNGISNIKDKFKTDKLGEILLNGKACKNEGIINCLFIILPFE